MGGIASKKTWVTLCVALLGALAVILSSVPAALNTTFRTVAHADPKGIKYLGSGSCGGNGCHSDPVKDPKPMKEPGHDELTIWQNNDGHARAFRDDIKKRKGLMNDATKKIVAKMADKTPPTENHRCLSCHALTGFSNGESKTRIPLNLDKPGVDIEAEDMEKGRFKKTDGVTCDACHGPSSKYLTPHQKAGWTAGMRTAMSGDALYDTWGLYNTKDLNMRANLCVSCHLKIDPDMVDAGHPSPTFELDTMSHGKWMHWRPNSDYFGPKAWVMGQFVCVREAALQLAERVKAKAAPKLIDDAYQQLMSHVLMAAHGAKYISEKGITSDDPALKKLNDVVKTLGAKYTEQVAAINSKWADPAAVEAACHELGKTVDQLADGFNAHISVPAFKKDVDSKALLEYLIKDVAAEGEAASKLGYDGALQYSYAMTSLIEATVLEGIAPDPDPEKMAAMFKQKGGDIYKLGSAVSDTVVDGKDDYKPDDFLAAAKKLMALDKLKGGTPIPLPPGGPTIK